MPVRRLALAGALTVAAFLGVSYAAPSRQASGVAHFRERLLTYANTGFTPASTEAWRTSVSLLSKDQVVGSGGIACVRIVSSTRECFGTYILPTGRIKVVGEINNRTHYSMAVVGGTGNYLNASGVVSFDNGFITFFLT